MRSATLLHWGFGSKIRGLVPGPDHGHHFQSQLGALWSYAKRKVGQNACAGPSTV